MDTVFGTMDSVISYSVFLTDSVTFEGEIRLSKAHGLLSFVSFHHLAGETMSGRFDLVGLKDSNQSSGYALPGKTDFFPYSIGDSLVLSHSGQRMLSPGQWEEFTEYLKVDITALDTTLSGLAISGVAQRFDEQLFYIGTDNSFTFDFPLLGHALEHPVSVPHGADVSGVYHGNLVSQPRWAQEGISEVVLRTGGYETDICGVIIVDGLSLFQDYSSEYGFMYSQAGSISMPPEEYRLLAARGANFSYNDWPHRLSVDEAEPMGTLNIYPNPADEQVNISLDAQGEVELSVYDLTGNEVLTGRLMGQGEVDISTLAAGMYIFRLTSSEGTAAQCLVVK